MCEKGMSVIRQELALHGGVCKYGVLLFETNWLRRTSAKIGGISTILGLTWKTHGGATSPNTRDHDPETTSRFSDDESVVNDF